MRSLPTEGTVSENSSQGSKTSDNNHIYRVAIVAPTCFYYQVPLFRVLAAHPRIELMVYFCSQEALRSEDVPKKFHAEDTWGFEDSLLDGYNCKFLRNYSPVPSYLKPVFGLINFGIWREIRKTKPDMVILMSWMNPTWWLAISACLYSKIPFLYLTDQNVQRDREASKWKIWLKRLALGRFLFPLTRGFLCAGTANKLFYQHYGVPDKKLLPFAFSWGYEAFLEISEEIKSQKMQLRADLGVPEDSQVALYCGRLSPEKGPLHLLRAYASVKLPNKALAFVGDGQLRNTLQAYVKDHELESVYFFGFQNRQEVAKFYAISDVLVVPSDQETWGIVVNEALCFGLPIIVSDQVGAAQDLVRHGYNGFSFPKGDVDALAASITRVMGLTEDERSLIETRSRNLITTWLNRDLADPLVRYFDCFHTRDGKGDG